MKHLEDKMWEMLLATHANRKLESYSTVLFSNV